MDEAAAARFHELRNPIDPVAQPDLWQTVEATREPFARLAEAEEARTRPEEVLEYDVHFVATRETAKAILGFVHSMPTWCRTYRKTHTGRTDRDYREGR